MYKSIPGNGEYEVSIQDEFRKIDRSECELTIIDKKVTIPLYGEIKNVDVEWLSLMALFEVYLPDKFINQFFNINFIPVETPILQRKIPIYDKEIISTFTTNKLMVFKQPLTIKGKYRIIPNFVQYAISKEGEIVESKNPENIIYVPTNNNVGYRNVKLYSAEKNNYIKVKIHRLLAMAWLAKQHGGNKCYVNHIDGDKTNYELSNLEWVTPAENCQHAYLSGLREDNVPCKVRDIKTKEVKDFVSISQAAKYMNLFNNQLLISKNVRVAKLIKNRYEFKLVDDTSPWFYENVESPLIPGRYIISVINPDKTKMTFHDVKSLIRHFKIWNIPSQGIDCVIEHAKLKIPGIEITYIDQYPNGPYQAYEISTGKIFEHKTQSGLGLLISRDRSCIKRAMKKGQSYSLQGFAYREKTDLPWPQKFTEIDKPPTRISAVNIVTGKVRIFESIKAVARELNIDKITARRRAESKTPVKGLLLNIM